MQTDLHAHEPTLQGIAERYLAWLGAVRPTAVSAHRTVLDQFASHATQMLQATSLAAIPTPWILVYITMIDRRPVARLVLADFYVWAKHEQLIQTLPCF